MNAKLRDPEFELSDIQLRDLIRAAFADAEERHQHALDQLHARIAAARRARREQLARAVK